MTRFLDALNALDADAMSAFFAEDITAFVPTARPERVQGRAAVDEIFRAFVSKTRETRSRLSLEPESMEVVVSGDLGLVSFQTRDRGANITRRRTFVFARHRGVWRIRHFHASDIAEPRP
jgi:ketosteroid isomerase-like protein